jgi:hypothetical protein
MKLAEIADRLHSHFKRWESSQKLNPLSKEYGTRRYFHPGAWARGSRVFVRYVSYQCDHSIKKSDAEAYLAWIEAGNVGTVWEWERAAGRRQ